MIKNIFLDAGGVILDETEFEEIYYGILYVHFVNLSFYTITYVITII